MDLVCMLSVYSKPPKSPRVMKIWQKNAFPKIHIFRRVALVKKNQFAQKKFALISDKNKTFVKKTFSISHCLHAKIKKNIHICQNFVLYVSFLIKLSPFLPIRILGNIIQSV